MEIEIIEPEKSSLESAVNFCQNLNVFLGEIKICHLFTTNYNSHIIWGNLYDTLSDKFDTIEEEVIGILRNDINLSITESPLIAIDSTDINALFGLVVIELRNLLDSLEHDLESFPKNGIRNTIEEIYTEINKSIYLLELNGIKISLTPETIVSVPEIQTNKLTDYLDQTSENLPV